MRSLFRGLSSFLFGTSAKFSAYNFYSCIFLFIKFFNVIQEHYYVTSDLHNVKKDCSTNIFPVEQGLTTSVFMGFIVRRFENGKWNCLIHLRM